MADERPLELIAAIADDLPVAIWVAKAPGGEFVYANRLFSEIMGMGARDDVSVGEYAQPYGIHDRTGALYPEDRMPFVRALRERKVVFADDIVIHRTDGQKMHIRAWGKPIFDEKGEIRYVAIVFLDITRLVAAEKSRDESRARLHEIQNLLASIKIHASAIAISGNPDAARERISESAEHALALMRLLFPDTAGPVPSPVARIPVAGTRRHVLIVDDESDVRDATAAALHRLGFETILAHDGDEAVETFAARRDDILAVVLDVRLPKVDGGEALRKILEIEPDARVVVTSGLPVEHEAHELLALGARAFLEKPYDVHSLGTALADALA